MLDDPECPDCGDIMDEQDRSGDTDWWCSTCEEGYDDYELGGDDDGT